jgi:small subunit ribosomal protein S5
MSDEQKVQQNTEVAAAPAAPKTQDEVAAAALARFSQKTGADSTSRGPGGSRGGSFQRGGRGGDRKPMVKKKEEFGEQNLDMRRVARVMAGGKRFSFRATLVIGDGRGRVGVGIGKGIDVQQALGKAKRDAQKHMIVVPLQKRTIPHEVEAKFSAARIRLKPAKDGNGLIAGGAVRAVLTLAGVKDITAKILGRTPNKLTNALATIEALKLLKPRKTKAKESEKVEAKASNAKS